MQGMVDDSMFDIILEDDLDDDTCLESTDVS